MPIGCIGVLRLVTAGPRVWARQSRFALSQGKTVVFKVHPTDSATWLHAEERSLNMHVLDLDLTQVSLAGAEMLGQFGQCKPGPSPLRSSPGFEAATAAGPSVPVKLVMINGAATQRNTISPIYSSPDFGRPKHFYLQV